MLAAALAVGGCSAIQGFLAPLGSDEREEQLSPVAEEERLDPINRYNLDKRLEQTAPGRVAWAALTTGGFGGFDAWLAEPAAGTLKIETALVQTEIPVAEIGLEDRVFEAGGIARRIRVFRLPDENPQRRVTLERRIALAGDRDNALYVCLTQEDGHLVWSSPIYIFR